LISNEYNRSISKLSEIMIASTSHDMRTPLNTILTMHGMIENKLEHTKQNECLLNWLSAANSSTNLLLYLVNDTLDYF
jgi:K+-sensing histidine kinase KdpD